MPKHVIRVVGSIVVAFLATLVVSQHRSIDKLQGEIQSLREEREQPPEPTAPNTDTSDLKEQKTQSEIQPNEPSLELLRLRGEVGLLRREHAEFEQLRQENVRLRFEIRAMRSPEIDTILAGQDFDTNSILRIEPGASTKLDVLEELRRVGATVLDEREEFIHAQLSHAAPGSTNGAVNTATLECYFTDGKLTTSRLIPKNFKRRTPNPFE